VNVQPSSTLRALALAAAQADREEKERKQLAVNAAATARRITELRTALTNLGVPLPSHADFHRRVSATPLNASIYIEGIKLELRATGDHRYLAAISECPECHAHMATISSVTSLAQLGQHLATLPEACNDCRTEGGS
jgi:hypothetical protein